MCTCSVLRALVSVLFDMMNLLKNFFFFFLFFFYFFIFFFQAEDGIRDTSVTGVQTCALPIYQPLFQLCVNDSAQQRLFRR